MKTTVLHARIDPKRRGLPFPVAIPNARTRKAIKDGRAGKNLQYFDSEKKMFTTWDKK